MVYPVNRYIAVYGGFGMTFKIDDEYGKYKISIGTGRTYKANNVYELRLAVEHYFDHTLHGKNIARKGYLLNQMEDCPLCCD